MNLVRVISIYRYIYYLLTIETYNHSGEDEILLLYYYDFKEFWGILVMGLFYFMTVGDGSIVPINYRYFFFRFDKDLVILASGLEVVWTELLGGMDWEEFFVSSQSIALSGSVSIASAVGSSSSGSV